MTRVLLADDDDFLRFTVRMAFERHGHSVTEAGDGDECLRRLTDDAFELVCMDAQMPGASLQQRIDCAHAAMPNAPRLVVLTGRIEPGMEELLRVGDQLLQKPISLTAIDRMIAPAARSAYEGWS